MKTYLIVIMLFNFTTIITSIYDINPDMSLPRVRLNLITVLVNLVLLIWAINLITKI